MSICYFCNSPTQQTLCESCFTQAFNYAKEYYKTDDIPKMIHLAMSGDEGDALTFRYSSEETEAAKDITNAEFMIDDYSSVTEICKYDPLPLFSREWIDLSTGEFSVFWQQALDYEKKLLTTALKDSMFSDRTFVALLPRDFWLYFLGNYF